jgi:hypothetical protein
MLTTITIIEAQTFRTITGSQPKKRKKKTNARNDKKMNQNE